MRNPMTYTRAWLPFGMLIGLLFAGQSVFAQDTATFTPTPTWNAT